MATTVVRQFVATINSGTSALWDMVGVNPPFNRALRDNAKPEWIVEWQAIPLKVSVDIDDPRIRAAKAGLVVSPAIVIQEDDTSLTHRVQITCVDVGNNVFTPARFVTTYALYAVFHDVP